MRKVRTLVAAAMLAGGLTLSIGVAPAEAAATLRNVYYYDWDCHRVGALGIDSGWWTSYQCVPQYNLWFLYA
ncbi:hypothetical protein Sru01_64830 [Sphaerisporangium rufum]|uniref:Secreted protein n=1 Tax=Sphaerisporangium rufum TaxID=1381558 RepID=A0A919R8B5_9ACTN|nr:hypothetical protein [Sphaerisporangium rufum]GII81501.1 hypothetical protein Sru01_64830 [Sphaerisporangium rufum]